jgi:hypothetical protein
MAGSLEYTEKCFLAITLVSLKCSRKKGFRCLRIGTGGKLLRARISKLMPALKPSPPSL